MKVKGNVKINYEELFHCPWNPRGEITTESVADLTASIREKGLLQDIGAMRRPDGGGYWVIYGNRRLVASVEAGLADIPCKVYSDLTETDAREITRIENEVRLGIDPLKDAELLHSFVEAGRSYKDIGLMFGVSPATVCRREKLINLDESIRKILGGGKQIATNALEHIASYPAEIQKKAAHTISNRSNYGEVSWNDLSYTFNGLTSDLDAAAFIKAGYSAKCTACTKRTGCQTDLFGELTGDGKLGRCLDGACFDRTCEKWMEDELNRRIPAECTERVKRLQAWQIEGKAYGDKFSKTRPCAYWVISWDGKIIVKFGPSEARLKEEEAEQERMREDERQAGLFARMALGKVHEKISTLLLIVDDDDHKLTNGVGLNEIVRDYFANAEDDCEKISLFLEAVVRLGIYGESSDDFRSFRVLDVVENPAETFVKLFADSIYQSVDGCDWNEQAKTVVRLFNLNKHFTKEELALLK